MSISETFLFKGLKPFSVNASYIRTFAGVSKSSGATEFAAQIFNCLTQHDNQVKVAKLKSEFNEITHAYSVAIVAYYPESEFYTKKGTISSRTVDLSNAEKGLIDCLFLPKFDALPFPQGANNLCVDDRCIVDMSSKKRPAKERAIEVTITIVERP